MRTLILALFVLLGSVLVIATKDKAVTAEAKFQQQVKAHMAKIPKVTSKNKSQVKTTTKDLKHVQSSKITEENFKIESNSASKVKVGYATGGFYGSLTYDGADENCQAPLIGSFTRLNVCKPNNYESTSETKGLMAVWDKSQDTPSLSTLTSTFNSDNCMYVDSADTGFILDLGACNVFGGMAFSQVFIPSNKLVVNSPTPGVLMWEYDSAKGCAKRHDKNVDSLLFFATGVCRDSVDGSSSKYDCTAEGQPMAKYYSDSSCTTETSSVALTNNCNLQPVIFECHAGNTVPASNLRSVSAK